MMILVPVIASLLRTSSVPFYDQLTKRIQINTNDSHKSVETTLFTMFSLVSLILISYKIANILFFGGSISVSAIGIVIGFFTSTVFIFANKFMVRAIIIIGKGNFTLLSNAVLLAPITILGLLFFESTINISMIITIVFSVISSLCFFSAMLDKNSINNRKGITLAVTSGLLMALGSILVQILGMKEFNGIIIGATADEQTILAFCFQPFIVAALKWKYIEFGVLRDKAVINTLFAASFSLAISFYLYTVSMNPNVGGFVITNLLWQIVPLSIGGYLLGKYEEKKLSTESQNKMKFQIKEKEIGFLFAVVAVIFNVLSKS